MRRIFREYLVLLAAETDRLENYQRLIEPLGFGRIKKSSNGSEALKIINEKKPDVVVACKDLPGLAGLDLLAQTRASQDGVAVPFIIVGDKEDLRMGGAAARVHQDKRARMIARHLTGEAFSQTAAEFLDPFIDRSKEEGYRLYDEALEAMRAGDFDRAAELFRESLNHYERHQAAWMMMAEAQIRMGDEDEAESSYLMALEVNKYNLKVYFGLTRMYEQRKEYDQARGIYEQAQGVAVIIKSPDQVRSRIAFEMGRLDLKLKRPDEAGESFDQAIETNPEDAQLRTDIGDAYAEEGFFEQAEEHYAASLSIDPNLAHVFNKLGMAYRRQHKYDKALEIYHNARAHHPDDENLLFNIARTHFDAGQYSECENLLAEALRINPDFKAARVLMSKLSASRQTIELGID